MAGVSTGGPDLRLRGRKYLSTRYSSMVVTFCCPPCTGGQGVLRAAHAPRTPTRCAAVDSSTPLEPWLVLQAWAERQGPDGCEQG